MDKKWMIIIIIVILLVVAIIAAIVIANNQNKVNQAMVSNTNTPNPLVGKSNQRTGVQARTTGTRTINVGSSRRKRSPPATYRQSVGRKA